MLPAPSLSAWVATLQVCFAVLSNCGLEEGYTGGRLPVHVPREVERVLAAFEQKISLIYSMLRRLSSMLGCLSCSEDCMPVFLW